MTFVCCIFCDPSSLKQTLLQFQHWAHQSSYLAIELLVMSSATPFWCPDPSLAAAQIPSSSTEHFVIAPAGAADTEQVLKLFAACGVPGFDVVAVREVSNPRLTDGFHSRLAQLQTRSGNPPFRPKYLSESDPTHRDAVIQVVKTLAGPFTDPSFPDVSIVPVWHGRRRR